ncbi:cupin domain-containing protein [Nitratifractor sp.]
MNLFNCIPPVNGETFTTLLEHKNVKIIRIVSSDAPDRKFYRQEEDEWVVILEGSAVLEIDGKRHRLQRGESVFLPAGTPHRVLETASGTIWLAIHIF